MTEEFQILGQTEQSRQKIRDIKAIVLQGPRSYTLVSVSYMAYMPVIRLQI